MSKVKDEELKDEVAEEAVVEVPAEPKDSAEPLVGEPEVKSEEPVEPEKPEKVHDQ